MCAPALGFVKTLQNYKNDDVINVLMVASLSCCKLEMDAGTSDVSASLSLFVLLRVFTHNSNALSGGVSCRQAGKRHQSKVPREPPHVQPPPLQAQPSSLHQRIIKLSSVQSLLVVRPR